MTFKHIKFEDSVVMRSLEKLYKEKGLIKEEPLKKEASSKLDLRASSNLMENIFKLCTGLRSYGLDKQANELESNYLSYKKANTLYETSKENGEDLINAAHPKGSHKVDVLGDDLAVVETILDRHLKMIKIVDKVPTGKLASNTIINSVKRALGGEDNNSKIFSDILNNFSNFIGYLVDTFNLIQRDSLPSKVRDFNIFRPVVTFQTDEARLIKFKDEIFYDIVGKKTLSIRTIYEIIEIMNKIISVLQGIKITDESKMNQESKTSAINKMQSFIIQLNNLAIKMKSESDALFLNKSTESKSSDSIESNVPKPSINQVEKRVITSLNLINRYQNELNADLKLSDKDKLNGKNWLDKQKLNYTAQLNSFQSTPEENKKDIMPRILQNIDLLDSKLQTFYKEFLA